VANAYVYDSYGRTLTVFESAPQPFTYTGREHDSESGLYYYRARYYDPQTGRFLGEDPIGFDAGDQNLYRYVFNDPVNLIDPSGNIGLAGFGVGVTIDLAFQLLENEGNLACLDFGRLLTAGAVGALGGVGFNALLPKIFSKLKTLGIAFKGLSQVGNKIRRGTKQSLEQRAADLVKRNDGRNRVSILRPDGRTNIDLQGKAHGNVPTPHVQDFKNNIIQSGPRVGQIGSRSKAGDIRPATFEDLRIVDRFLKSQGK